MSSINGLTGPRVPTATPSSAQATPSTSFLSRVQAAASGVSTLPKQANAPAVSGRDIISKAIETAKGSASNAAATDEQTQQRQALQEMSRAFVMGTVQSIFGAVGQSGSSLPKAEDWG
ncbi:hypothetical protein [Vitiosangium sp. GDMCC 1.1324]|uniref:hypothetical protein n=1 Tax=Vitiosangium sp. (strain GDMCC 1.1324) TaxID=2138576 RepID=UPI000D3C1241|nr:hypothetical protein [Vitiosangium sp. GDMCC 1.1324]PTL78143.1 hypothetical protein DAT35_41770 [Vitiosangium sp. GDMCC 1.1324]